MVDNRFDQIYGISDVNRVSRQIEIELTAEQEPVWDETLRHCRVLGPYYDPPVSPVTRGKAALECDDDVVLAMVAALKELAGQDKRIGEEIIRKLVHGYRQEKIF